MSNLSPFNALSLLHGFLFYLVQVKADVSLIDLYVQAIGLTQDFKTALTVDSTFQDSLFAFAFTFNLTRQRCGR